MINRLPPQHRTRTRSSFQRMGMTLVELLVVIVILVVLLSVAIPLMRPAFKDRKLREASRQVNSMIARAKARAAETGREAGIWIERRNVDFADPLNPTAAEINLARQGLQIYICEVAPAFTGMTQSSVASFGFIDPSNLPSEAPPLNPAQPTSSPPGGDYYLELKAAPGASSPRPADEQLLMTMVQTNETFRIKFDNRGEWFLCKRIQDPRDGREFVINFPEGPPAYAGGASFEIVRAPLRSSREPVDMPGDTIVDLSVSGVGLNGLDPSNGAAVGYLFDPSNFPPRADNISAPVMIMFNPDGSVASVFFANTSIDRITNTTYLLIGRNVNTLNPKTTDLTASPTNLNDPSTIWVSIGHRTGLVTSSENAAIDPSTLVAPGTLEANPGVLLQTRDIARDSVRMGGR